jgi:hypothetical protein
MSARRQRRIAPREAAVASASLNPGNTMFRAPSQQRKSWYVFLICVGLGSALMSVVGDLFFYLLGRHAVLIGGLPGRASSTQ